MTRKILIVDDDEIFVNTLRAEFSGEGEVTIVATDGEEGFNKAKSELPDAILLDVIMPKMLGISVIERLREEDTTKFIPIIVVSNFGGENNEKRARELGASEFLVKTSVTPKQIAEAVRKYFPADGSLSGKLTV